MNTNSRPDCVVVDTNVLAVAEGIHSGATDECRAACVKLAKNIQAGLTLAVDSSVSGEMILREYLTTLKGAKSSGVGSKLAVYLWHRRHDSKVRRRVDITRCGDSSETFEEVPTHLTDFDNDDHKWITVASAEGSKPQIFQALDAEWWRRRKDFAAAGLDVQFLCVGDLIDQA